MPCTKEEIEDLMLLLGYFVITKSSNFLNEFFNF